MYSFIPANEIIEKESYYTLLKYHLESSLEKSQTSIFQQDSAPSHTAHLLKDWFPDCHIDYIKDGPSNSPYLSSIENLWAIMKTHLRDRDTSTLEKLKITIQEEWDSFSIETIRNLADSVPNRL